MKEKEKSDNQLESKRALARQAMGGDARRVKKAHLNLIKDRERQRAIQAMENPTQQGKRLLDEKTLVKRRLDAQKAMASPAQRQAKEQEARKLRQQQEIKEKLEKNKLAQAQTKKQKEYQEKAELEKIRTQKNKQQKEYLKHLQQSNQLIETIATKEKPDLDRYRTFKTDSDQVVTKENLSLADIAIKERQKEISHPKTTGSNTRINKTITIATILFLLVATVGVVYFALRLSDKLKKTELVITQSIVFAEEHIKLKLTDDLEPDQIHNRLSEAVHQDLPQGSISHIYLTQEKLNPESEEYEESLVSPAEMFDLLALNLPTGFNYFLTDQYMLGAYHSDENLPFLILKTTSFENTLNTLLKNETLIVSSILSILDPKSDSLLTAQFADKIIQNVDARIALDATSGQIIGLYAFFDQNTVIFGQNEKVLSSILERLRTTSVSP